MDLINGISIRIDGDRTKYNTLPLDELLSLAKSFQSLIMDIAKSGLDDEDSFKLDNFKIELSGFKVGSAVPQFSFTHSHQLILGANIEEQQRKVNDKLCKVLTISSGRNFKELNEVFPCPENRNDVLRSLHGFTNSVGNASLSIVDKNLNPEYMIQKLSNKVMKALIVDIESEEKEESKEKSITLLAQIKQRGKSGRRQIIKTYDNKIVPTFDPDIINCSDGQYILKHPLRSKISEIDGKVVIENELLGIYSYGDNIDQAEEMFAEEFDYLFVRYNDLEDAKLTKDAKFIRDYLNQIVCNHG